MFKFFSVTTFFMMDRLMGHQDSILQRAEERRRRALQLIGELQLLERWSRFGKPFVLGSVKMGLVVARDIDLNIYSDSPRIEEGFHVMSQIALLPGVYKIRFTNALNTPDQGLYWQIIFRDQSAEEWKIDNWFLSTDHPDAGLGEALAEGMLEILTEDTRRIILEIKEALLGKAGIRGIDIYRAVIEGGVRAAPEFLEHKKNRNNSDMVDWRP